MICNTLSNHWQMCQHLRHSEPPLHDYAVRYFQAKVKNYKNLDKVEQKALTCIRLKEINHTVAMQ